MSNPEEIRRDIERTRAELSENVNALTDSAKPQNIAREQVDKVKEGAANLKEKIFGRDDNPYDQGRVGEAKDTVAGAVGGVADKAGQMVDDVKDQAAGLVSDAQAAVADAPQQLTRQAKGNPLAAGLVALGLGALVGGLMPSTRTEQRYATQLQEQAQPLVDEAKSMAQEMGQKLQPLAADAVETVKQTAAQAAQTVGSQASDAAALVGEHAKDAAANVKEEAQVHVEETKTDAAFAAQDVKETAKDAAVDVKYAAQDSKQTPKW